MVITQSDLEQIIAQASFISERLSTSFSKLKNDEAFKIDTTAVSQQQVSDERLARWCHVVAQGNWEKFHKRLQWDGLDIDTVRPILGSYSFEYTGEAQEMPTWGETLREIIQSATELDLQDKTNIPREPENPVPFEDVLLPAVLVARQKLLTALDSPSLSPDSLPLALLTEAAYKKLEHSLLERLVQICGKTLDFEFTHSRPLGHNLLSLLIGETQENSTDGYNAFVDKLLQDGLLTFFQKYPVLGRLMATAIDLWVEVTAELLQRIQADLSEIQQIFSQQSTINKVTEIKTSLSDPHNRGRSVTILTFDSGLKLVYKPKNIGLEVAYNQFLEWCNQQINNSPPLFFKIIKIINRETYGWVEYVEHLPCEDEAAAERFYQRAGKLLCLLYFLRTTDCHRENLIASGEHLVLIDMETLMHHEANSFGNPLGETTTQTVLTQQLYNSVLRTGILPSWEINRDNEVAYDISGLGSVEAQQTPRRSWRWKSINTDDMRLSYDNFTVPLEKNSPILNGVPLSPNDYLDSIVAGFKQMYHFLLEQRQTLLAEDSPLAAFSAQRVRFVFRPTKIYFLVLNKSFAPEFLKNGVDWSIELEAMSRAFLTPPHKPYNWSVCGSELSAMQQLDIPYFAASSDSDVLSYGVMSPIEHFFKKPSYSQVITQLASLDETDLARQVALIQGAFYARVARQPGSITESDTESTTLEEADFSQVCALTVEQLLGQASQIAQDIQARAIKETDGSVNWIGLSYIPKVERFQLMPLGDNFYDGSCGIALFLAALDYVKGNSEFRHLALGAIHSLRQFLQKAKPEDLQEFAQVGIGGAAGLGSIIYCLVKMSQFLQETELLADAQKFANLITPELIASDKDLDIVKGAAGAILGLLALYNETKDGAVLDKAVICGQHLVEHQMSSEDGIGAWKTFAQKPLTGFSHGAAGIAYSLLRLYKVTQQDAFLKVASEGIAYERSVFEPSVANWPNFIVSGDSENVTPGFMVSWCHGAPGIGLGRLGGLSILDTDEIRQDIEAALLTTKNYNWQGVAHLCCGQFGRIEMLLVAAQKLQRKELRDIAQLRAAWVIANASKTGAFKLFLNLPSEVFIPCFFQGNAGIGYELLRLAKPEVLPSVLLWE